MKDDQIIKIVKVAEDRYNTFISKSMLEKINIPMESLYTPNSFSTKMLSVIGKQLADELVASLEKNNDPNAENPCEISEFVTNEGVMIVFQFFDDEDIDWSDSEDYDDDDYNCSAQGDIAYDHIVGIFDSINKCFEFYNKTLYKSNRCSVELVKYRNEYGLYIEANPETVSEIEAKIEEFYGDYIYVNRAYFEEKDAILADRHQFEKIISTCSI